MWDALTSREMVAALVGVLVAEVGITLRGWWRGHQERKAVRQLLIIELSHNWAMFRDFWRAVHDVNLSGFDDDDLDGWIWLARRFVDREFPRVDRAAWNGLLARIPESLSGSEIERVNALYGRLESMARLHHDLAEISANDAANVRAAPMVNTGRTIVRDPVSQRFPMVVRERWPECKQIGERIILDGVPLAAR